MRDKNDPLHPLPPHTILDSGKDGTVKEFRVIASDSYDGKYYEIYSINKKTGSINWEGFCAQFYGKRSRKFADEHCKRLNALSEKEKP